MKATLLITVIVLAYPDPTAPTVGGWGHQIPMEDLATCQEALKTLRTPSAEIDEARAARDYIRELALASTEGRIRTSARCVGK